MPKQLVPLDAISLQDRQSIEEQMERLLSHQLFRLSKRLPAFLVFVVRESMQHNGNFPPKERVLGVEVFGRKPDYDTNADPIVRVTATELRKKLAQYYYAEGHQDEIRIEIPLGSYLPRFSRSIETEADEPVTSEPIATESIVTPALPAEVKHTHQPELAKSPAEPEPIEAAAPLPPSPPPVATASFETPYPSRWKFAAISFAVLLVAALAGYAPFLRHLRPTPLDLFWKSFAGSSNSVKIVMPVILRQDTPANNQPSDVSVAPNLSIEDTTIAAHIAAQLEKSGSNYWLASSSEIHFGELRTGPAILIGALDNVWTLRLSKDLPFSFEESADGRTGRIVEAGNAPNRRTWALDITTPHGRIGRDYGIVARFHSKLTGEPILIVAGISSQGTQAAGEILTTPTEFASALAGVQGAENFELVIETQAIEGRAGPPHVVATKSW